MSVIGHMCFHCNNIKMFAGSKWEFGNFPCVDPYKIQLEKSPNLTHGLTTSLSGYDYISLNKSETAALNRTYLTNISRDFFPSLPVDVDISGLANSVAPVLCLGVHGGIPVAVVEHDCVGSSQVHPDTSAASW